MTYAELLRLVELIKRSGQFCEFHVKVGDMEVTLRRGSAPRAAFAPATPLPASPAPPDASANLFPPPAGRDEIGARVSRALRESGIA